MKKTKVQQKVFINTQKETIFGQSQQAINQGQIVTPPINMYQVLRQPLKQDHPPIPDEAFFS